MDLESAGIVGSVGATLWGQKELLQTIYGDLAQPSVRKVGQALSNVIEYCGGNYVSFGSEKQKILFTKRLEEYKDNINNIPEENITEAPPEIGVRIFEKLSYTTNDDIASLFIELLTKASSLETIHLAQPRFISIIEDLSADEAQLIAYMKGLKNLPYYLVRVEKNDGAGKDITGNLTGIEHKVEFIFPKNLWSYLDNLVSFGIIDDKRGIYLDDESLYTEIESYYDDRNVIAQQLKDMPIYKDHTINIVRSYYHITNFGENFIECCTRSI